MLIEEIEYLELFKDWPTKATNFLKEKRILQKYIEDNNLTLPNQITISEVYGYIDSSNSVILATNFPEGVGVSVRLPINFDKIKSRRFTELTNGNIVWMYASPEVGYIKHYTKILVPEKYFSLSKSLLLNQSIRLKEQ